LSAAQKGKANIKSFGKGWGVQGGRKEPFSKGFSLPLPAGLRNRAMPLAFFPAAVIFRTERGEFL
ncbi:MAG: hypothetical protein IKD46_09760, partial [Lentisphaeria bacterium]|nr:hypothetical protein [Lentisphaeria bacterium]